jgi:hypothetical protein
MGHEFYDQEREPTDEEVAALLAEVEDFAAEASPVATFEFNHTTLHSLELLLRLGMSAAALLEHDGHNCPTEHKGIEVAAMVMEHMSLRCSLELEDISTFADTMLNAIKNIWNENPELGEWVPGNG